MASVPARRSARACLHQMLCPVGVSTHGSFDPWKRICTYDDTNQEKEARPTCPGPSGQCPTMLGRHFKSTKYLEGHAVQPCGNLTLEQSHRFLPHDLTGGQRLSDRRILTSQYTKLSIISEMICVNKTICINKQFMNQTNHLYISKALFYISLNKIYFEFFFLSQNLNFKENF